MAARRIASEGQFSCYGGGGIASLPSDYPLEIYSPQSAQSTPVRRGIRHSQSFEEVQSTPGRGYARSGSPSFGRPTASSPVRGFYRRNNTFSIDSPGSRPRALNETFDVPTCPQDETFTIEQPECVDPGPRQNLQGRTAQTPPRTQSQTPTRQQPQGCPNTSPVYGPPGRPIQHVPPQPRPPRTQSQYPPAAAWDIPMDDDPSLLKPGSPGHPVQCVPPQTRSPTQQPAQQPQYPPGIAWSIMWDDPIAPPPQPGPSGTPRQNVPPQSGPCGPPRQNVPPQSTPQRTQSQYPPGEGWGIMWDDPIAPPPQPGPCGTPRQNVPPQSGPCGPPRQNVPPQSYPPGEGWGIMWDDPIAPPPQPGPCGTPRQNVPPQSGPCGTPRQNVPPQSTPQRTQSQYPPGEGWGIMWDDPIAPPPQPGPSGTPRQNVPSQSGPCGTPRQNVPPQSTPQRTQSQYPPGESWGIMWEPCGTPRQNVPPQSGPCGPPRQNVPLQSTPKRTRLQTPKRTQLQYPPGEGWGIIWDDPIAPPPQPGPSGTPRQNVPPQSTPQRTQSQGPCGPPRQNVPPQSFPPAVAWDIPWDDPIAPPPQPGPSGPPSQNLPPQLTPQTTQSQYRPGIAWDVRVGPSGQPRQTRRPQLPRTPQPENLRPRQGAQLSRTPQPQNLAPQPPENQYQPPWPLQAPEDLNAQGDRMLAEFGIPPRPDPGLQEQFTTPEGTEAVRPIMEGILRMVQFGLDTMEERSRRAREIHNTMTQLQGQQEVFQQLRELRALATDNVQCYLRRAANTWNSLGEFYLQTIRKTDNVEQGPWPCLHGIEGTEVVNQDQFTNLVRRAAVLARAINRELCSDSTLLGQLINVFGNVEHDLNRYENFFRHYCNYINSATQRTETLQRFLCYSQAEFDRFLVGWEGTIRPAEAPLDEAECEDALLRNLQDPTCDDDSQISVSTETPTPPTSPCRGSWSPPVSPCGIPRTPPNLPRRVNLWISGISPTQTSREGPIGIPYFVRSLCEDYNDLEVQAVHDVHNTSDGNQSLNESINSMRSP